MITPIMRKDLMGDQPKSDHLQYKTLPIFLMKFKRYVVVIGALP
jgi:hypothetical protein